MSYRVDMQLSKTHGGSQRLKQQSRSLPGSKLGPLQTYMVFSLVSGNGVSLILLTALWTPFPPTEFPHPVLMRGFVPGLNVSCVIFG